MTANPYLFITSPDAEREGAIAYDFVSKSYVYAGRYKTGETCISGKFKPIYNRQRMAVFGKSGSGKTTWSSFIASSYHKQFPDRDIILISPHLKEDEKALAKQIGFIQQLEISETPEPVDATEEFKDCLVLIDDIKGFKTKAQNDFVAKLAHDLMYNCRKYGVSVVISNHQLLDGPANKLLNFEAQLVTFFPQSKLAWRQIEAYCKKYLGLDTAAIEEIKGSQSRWITIATETPSYVLTENKVYML